MFQTTTLTVSEVAAHLRISRTKAYELANSGSFTVIKIGRSLRIISDSFENWMMNQ